MHTEKRWGWQWGDGDDAQHQRQAPTHPPPIVLGPVLAAAGALWLPPRQRQLQQPALHWPCPSPVDGTSPSPAPLARLGCAPAPCTHGAQKRSTYYQHGTPGQHQNTYSPLPTHHALGQGAVPGKGGLAITVLPDSNGKLLRWLNSHNDILILYLFLNAY